MRVVSVALAAAVVLAAVASAQETSTGFRTCSRINFAGPLAAGGIAADTYLEEFGLTISVRRSPGSTSRGRAFGNDYTVHPTTDFVLFDTARVTGGDVDLGSPSYKCNSACPLGGDFSHCSCAGDILAERPELRDLYLPDGHPGCGPQDAPDLETCPGVGCGGGFWKQTQVAGTQTISYPFRLANGTVVPGNVREANCELELDPVGCPIPNTDGMNCRSATKVLIVQEHGGEPDDSSAGGVISFIFEKAIDFIGLEVLDMDESSATAGAGGVVYGMTSPDESVNTEEDYARTRDLVGTGDNSLTTVEGFLRDFTGIHRVVVWFRGSGSINDIEFCSGAEPNITVTTQETCVYSWNITKEVNQEQWDLFAGQSTEEIFTTTVTRSETCEPAGRTATGTVEIAAPNTQVHRIVDIFGGFDSDDNVDPAVTVSDIDTFTCSPFTPTAVRPFLLNPIDGVTLTEGGDTFLPGNTLTCEFSVAVNEVAVTDEASFLKVEFQADMSGGGGASIIALGSVAFDAPVVELNTEVVLTDTGAPGESTVVSDLVFVTNSTRVATCLKGSEGFVFDFDCTATITPPEGGTISDTASTQRRCYEVDVVKTAAGSVDYTFDWDIEKTAMPRHDTDRRTDLSFDPMDGKTTVQYELKSTATVVEGDYVVAGNVTVNNHHPLDAANVDLSDDTFGTAVFGAPCAGGAVSVPAGASVVCPYTITLATNPKERTNVATASLHGETYSGSAVFDFAINAVNPAAVVSDQFDGEAEAEVCRVSVTAPFAQLTFQCFVSRMFGPEECPTNRDQPIVSSYPNVGRVRSVDGDLFDSSSWLTTVTTVCETCADCVDPVMYPGYAGGDIHHVATSEDGGKTVSLCWD